MQIRIALLGATRKALVARLQQAYRYHRARLARRIHALLELGNGRSVAEVASLLDVGEQTVRDWLNALCADGIGSLSYRAPPGRPPKLTDHQRTDLRAALLAGPEEAGYASACWTSSMIADLIHLRCGVTYSPKYVSALLDGLGFSFQKARFTSDHLNEEGEIVWLETTWPDIVRVANEKGAIILFGDESSFAQWGTLGYTWAPKGFQPTVKTSGIRKAYRVFGLLDCFGGTLYYRGLEGKFNSDTYRDFLVWILTRVNRPMILIQDNAPYHTSALMKEFYAEHSDRLTVCQLPPYSPELNPIERLWKNVKKNATHLRYFATFASLVREVEKALTDFVGMPKALTALQGEYRELEQPAVA